MGAKRVTLTRTADWRFYLELDAAEARALCKMARTAVYFSWWRDCMAHLESVDVRHGGERIMKVIPELEGMLGKEGDGTK